MRVTLPAQCLPQVSLGVLSCPRTDPALDTAGFVFWGGTVPEDTCQCWLEIGLGECEMILE